MTHDEMIAVIQADKEGKIVEFWCANTKSWEDVPNPYWDFEKYKFRIKPEPRYRPFKNTKEVTEAIKKYGDWICWGKDSFKITSVLSHNHITYGKNGNNSFEYLFDEHFTFADGTPFGIIVEEK